MLSCRIVFQDIEELIEENERLSEQMQVWIF